MYPPDILTYHGWYYITINDKRYIAFGYFHTHLPPFLMIYDEPLHIKLNGRFTGIMDVSPHPVNIGAFDIELK